MPRMMGDLFEVFVFPFTSKPEVSAKEALERSGFETLFAPAGSRFCEDEVDMRSSFKQSLYPVPERS